MNPLVKASTPVAVKKTNKFSLKSQHLTTSNFMHFNCAYARPLIPKSHGKLVHKTFMRAEPLDKPCLGSAQVHNVCVWVPFRTVWEPWSDFIVDVPHNQPAGTGIIATVPRIQNGDLEQLFSTNALYSTQVGATDPYDFISGSNRYVLTYQGRIAMRLLESLGYKIVWSDKTLNFSALPLLCLAKAYLDYYYPQSYAHYGAYATIDGIFQRQITYTLSANELSTILEAIFYVGYNDDFYSALWDNPSGPASGVGSVNFSIPDVTTLVQNQSIVSTSDFVVQGTNGTPYVDSGDNLTQYLDDSLKALSQYVKRHQLSAFTIDRYLMEFGVSLDAAKMKRSVYIGDDSFPFQIGDVMSTSDTSSTGGASLGAYAGKGIGYSEGCTFDFNVDEFGYLFVLNSIVPDVSYVQGLDKNTLLVSKLDYLTGEFDGLGPDMVLKSELFVDHTGTSFNGDAVKAFAFGPRYYSWKIPYDRMTGAFRYDSINTDLNGWSTARLFNPTSSPSTFVHGYDFVMGSDFSQYDRIFLGYSDEDLQDPFYIIHHDDMTLYAPMRPLYEDCIFDDDSSGQVVTNRVGGVKVN